MAYITLGNLSKFLTNLRNTFVSKEHKTGSTTDYKVLSDNNLTDALVKKINEAGSSSFNGDYASLTSKPSIDGHEIAAGDQTAASLGLETAGAAAAARTGAVDDVKALGYQTAAQVGTAVANGTKGMVTDTALAAKGYQTADQVITIVAGKGYQTAAQVEATVTGKGYQTSGQVDAKVNAAKAELQNALGSAFRAKGSSEFAKLPALTTVKQGDVYNVSDAFTTTADFVDGAGKALPAGTNVVAVSVTSGETTKMQWDALTGMIDLSGYLRKADMVAATDQEIDALFTTTK